MLRGQILGQHKVQILVSEQTVAQPLCRPFPRLCPLIGPWCDHCPDNRATQAFPRPCNLCRTTPPVCNPNGLIRAVYGRAHKPG